VWQLILMRLLRNLTGTGLHDDGSGQLLQKGYGLPTMLWWSCVKAFDIDGDGI